MAYTYWPANYWPANYWPTVYLYWPFGVVVYATPGCRVYDVPAEDRIYEVTCGR